MPPARRRCRGSSRSRPRTSSSTGDGPSKAGPRPPTRPSVGGSGPGRRDASRLRRADPAHPSIRRRLDASGAGSSRARAGRRAGPRRGRAAPTDRRRHGRAAPARPGAPGSATRSKATLGSTSYDGADASQFEPDWGGASWYGTTSGTYWTINPKEYADPRKHGPEYQARARRAAAGRAGVPPPGDTVASDGADAAATPGASRPSGRTRRPRPAPAPDPPPPTRAHDVVLVATRPPGRPRRHSPRRPGPPARPDRRRRAGGTRRPGARPTPRRPTSARRPRTSAGR